VDGPQQSLTHAKNDECTVRSRLCLLHKLEQAKNQSNKSPNTLLRNSSTRCQMVARVVLTWTHGADVSPRKRHQRSFASLSSNSAAVIAGPSFCCSSITQRAWCSTLMLHLLAILAPDRRWNSGKIRVPRTLGAMSWCDLISVLAAVGYGLRTRTRISLRTGRNTAVFAEAAAAVLKARSGIEGQVRRLRRSTARHPRREVRTEPASCAR